MEVLIDVVISQISDCSNEKVATIATTINSNDDCVAFITLSLEKKVRSLRISQDDVVETEYGVCNLEQNLRRVTEERERERRSSNLGWNSHIYAHSCEYPSTRSARRFRNLDVHISASERASKRAAGDWSAFTSSLTPPFRANLVGSRSQKVAAGLER